MRSFVLFSISFFISAIALAQAPAKFDFKTDFKVGKCVREGTKTSCDPIVIAPAKPVSITLSDCDSTGPHLICTGIWRDSQSVDGIAFNTWIRLTKIGWANGQITYTLNVSVGQADSSSQRTHVSISLNADVLSDSIGFAGPTVTIDDANLDKTTRYTPYIRVTP